MPGLTDHILNITESNMRQYAREQYERDLYHGRSEIEKQADLRREFQREHCMSGEVMGTVEIPLVDRARKYIRMKAIVNEEGAELVKSIPTDGPLVVECDGRHYELVKNHGLGRNFELPVGVRPATVLGE